MAKPTDGRTDRWLERFDIVVKLMIGLATLGLTATLGYVAHSHNRHATELQVQAQAAELDLQKRITAVQILVDQLPTLVHGSDEERKLTLLLLEVVDPEIVRRFGERLLARAATPAEKESAQRIITSSESAAREQSARQHLETARKFMRFQTYPAAAREYLKAYDALPAERSAAIRAQAETARKLYDDGDFAAAAKVLEDAFGERNVLDEP